MMWSTAKLKDIAPSQPSTRRFAPDDKVCHLTLDQIESNTGEIINKRIKPAGDAGNSTYVFDEHNVLYSKLRPYLNKVVCPLEAGIATTELVPLRPNPKLIDRKYLAYYLRSPDFVRFASEAVAGVKMPRIIMTKLWSHEVPLPPLTEQSRIVEILDQADALRKQRAEADKKATRILPALFYQMFGDPAMNPNRWPLVQIRDLLEPVERLDPRSEPNKTFIYVDIAGVDGSSGAIVETKEILGVDAPSRARQIILENDVIISTVRPYLRATALVPEYLHNQICSTGFCVLRVRERYGFGFLYGLSRLQWFTDQLNARARGASYPAVTDNDILDLLIPYAESQELHKVYDSHIKELMAMQEMRRQSDGVINRLFDSLLHRAFSGGLTAKWREARMKELLQEMEHHTKVIS